MNRFFCALITLFAICQVKAQLSGSTAYDFGNIENFNNDTARFAFTNTGSRIIYLLQTPPADNYSVLCNTKTIAPGETMQLAIVYYTDKKGHFSLDVPLYFSHLTEPVKLSIKGNIKSILPTAFSVCPSIENSKPLKPGQVPLTILVYDAETRENIPGARVNITKNNVTFNCVPGLHLPLYQCKCDYGKLEVAASKKGYYSNRQTFNYNAENHTCKIYLEKEYIQETHVDTAITQRDSTVEKTDYVYIPSIVTDSGFNSYKYKPNHLVFIIDVSKSMKDSFKLGYLKKTIAELVQIVRPQDYFTLITYSGKVRVIFEHVSGANKTSIMKAIDTMHAGGGSNGAKSIVTAYEIANRYFIKDGNNQVFLATDGMLNSSSMGNEELYRLARREYNRNGIILSTIGFGHDEKALDFLSKLAQHGKGNFLTINILPSDISVLVSEVMKQSIVK